MVSIHRVPVIVHLIIRVISSTFRFKRGVGFIYSIRGSGMPEVNKRYDTPHLNRYGISKYNKYAPRPQSKQEMSVARRPYFVEIFQISYRGL